MEGVPYISKRFALERFLGLTEEEMKENDIKWREEQGDSENLLGGKSLRSAGITPGGLGADIDTLGDTGGDLGGEDLGAEGGEGEGEAEAEAGAEEDISI